TLSSLGGFAVMVSMLSRSGFPSDRKPIAPHFQLPIADQPDPMVIEQRASGTAGQHRELALPIVIAGKTRVGHFPCIEFAGVAHQFIDLAGAEAREAALQIRQVELAARRHGAQLRPSGVRLLSRSRTTR